MAEETQSTELEKHIAAEEAAIAAEEKRLREAPPTPPEGTDTGIPPVETKEVAEVKAEEKQVEAKPAEAKPEKTPEQIVREGALRRQLKEQQRELAELRKRAAESEKKPAEEVKEPTFDDDPAEFLKSRLTNVEAELARERAEKQAREMRDLVVQQEQAYEREHPDYRKALEYLEKDEVKEWELSGKAVADVNRLAQIVSAGRQGNAQAKPYAEHIEALAARADIQELAEKEGRTPEDVAIWLAARDTYLTGRRQEVWYGAQASGKNVGQIAYEFAQKRGYIPASQQQPKAEEKARAEVARAKEISAATESLSETATTEAGPGPKVVRNRSQILNLTDDELDAMISNGSYREI